MSKISCPRPDKAWRSQPGQLFAVVFALHTGPENEQAMQRLTAEYARAVGRSAQCNAKGAVQAG
ncbi:hypothetical protein [Streptomyces finlayi]|uniref:hypothetical protein n=1 Tax=Streptomyces finlayi TaxID=67296 RepID=UPI001673CD32|nr:hypothetical protein [Streptomyces finlayi]